jgi:Arc/MetJ-type ribon-helix-helix transcriptional regulator
MSRRTMNVRLSPSHRKWLAEQVSSGAFPSIDAALAWAIEGMMPLANDDLEWARPFLASGEASLARGEGVEGEEFLARLDRTIETLR